MFFFGQPFQAEFGRGPCAAAPTQLYADLELDVTASSADIKRSYRRLALLYHPDKNAGQEEKFRKVSAAYEILSDPERKARYDAHGIADDGGGGHDSDFHFSQPSDMFNDLFGHMGFGAPGGGAGPQRTTLHVLRMTLEEMFHGKTFKMKLLHDAPCSACDGRGGSDPVSCSGCGGSKVQKSMRHLGPGFVQHIEEPCPVCRGEGERMSRQCGVCAGKKTRAAEQVMEVRVPPGSADGYEIRKTHGASGVDAVIFRVEALPHDVYSRDGADLRIGKTLTLAESLCGFHYKLRQIDGSAFDLRSQPGIVTKPGDVDVLEGLGMPRLGGGRGSLRVAYSVAFPDRIADCAPLLEALRGRLSA